MENELLKKIRKIEIKTKSLSHQIFAGEYHSAFKGRGMAFSEVREYQFGDDVRNMDWNVTARLRSPYIKIFEEEREMTVVLLVDVSSSGIFGTSVKTKRELAAEVAAVLSFSASINNDKVGALFFSSKVEKFIPPKKGRLHLLRILRELLEFRPSDDGTNISEALRFLTNAIKNAEEVNGEKYIKITLKENMENGKTRISVFNTGKNIPLEDLNRIWNRFYKRDSSRNREQGGTGIGLAFVKAIMNNYDNRYGVENKENGVEFYIEL